MTDRRVIERMADALLFVTKGRSHNRSGVLLPSNRIDMQAWIRNALADPDEQLAVVVLPHLASRLDQARKPSVLSEVRHG